MKLYIGGAYQGQEELAARENPGAEILPAFHRTALAAFRRGEDPEAFAERFCREHPDAVVTADETGCGVIPAEPEARAEREAAGRALCVAARESESVTRVVCGIGTRIK